MRCSCVAVKSVHAETSSTVTNEVSVLQPPEDSARTPRRTQQDTVKGQVAMTERQIMDSFRQCSLLFLVLSCLTFACLTLYIYNISWVCCSNWPALMGLGPSVSGYSAIGREGMQFPTSNFFCPRRSLTSNLQKTQGTLRGTLRYGSKLISAYCALKFLRSFTVFRLGYDVKDVNVKLDYLILKLV